jgi:ABC-type ATPase involved in cell division
MSDTEKIFIDDDSLADIFPMDTSTSMVLVLGETGAGKSYFVRKLTANAQVKVGHNLDSCKSTYSSGGVSTSPLTLC